MLRLAGRSGTWKVADNRSGKEEFGGIAAHATDAGGKIIDVSQQQQDLYQRLAGPIRPRRHFRIASRFSSTGRIVLSRWTEISREIMSRRYNATRADP